MCVPGCLICKEVMDLASERSVWETRLITGISLGLEADLTAGTSKGGHYDHVNHAVASILTHTLTTPCTQHGFLLYYYYFRIKDATNQNIEIFLK